MATVFHFDVVDVTDQEKRRQTRALLLGTIIKEGLCLNTLVHHGELICEHLPELIFCGGKVRTSLSRKHCKYTANSKCNRMPRQSNCVIYGMTFEELTLSQVNRLMDVLSECRSFLGAFEVDFANSDYRYFCPYAKVEGDTVRLIFAGAMEVEEMEQEEQTLRDAGFPKTTAEIWLGGQPLTEADIMEFFKPLPPL